MKKLTVFRQTFFAFLAVCLFVVRMCVGQDAQDIETEDALLPIWSEDVLRLHAKSKVRSGKVFVYSPSMQYQDGGYFVSAVGNSFEEVAEKLEEAELKFRLGNDKDAIDFWAHFSDQNGYFLFSGHLKMTVGELMEGVKPVFNLERNDMVPILEGVLRASILILDEDGKTVQTQDLPVTPTGNVLFPGWFCGAPNAILVVRDKEGMNYSYEIWLPKRQENNPIPSKSGGFKISGHYTFVNPEKVYIKERYYRPSAEIEISKPEGSAVVTFDVSGIDDKGRTEQAKAVVILNSLDENEFEGYAFSLQGDKNVVLPNGKWVAFFIWESFRKPVKFPVDLGGGKG